MLIDRLPSGSPVFGLRLDEFLREWRKASDTEKAVLPDGRPAVRREGEPPSYLSLLPALWEHVRHRMKEVMAIREHPKRTRLCQACGTAMAVTHEYEDIWTFSCGRCRSVEAWGKNIAGIGGQTGAGEKEKR